MVLEPRPYPEIDYGQGEKPISASMRAEFRDEITPRRLANAEKVFNLIELLGRQWLLDEEHVARMKSHMPEPAGKEYLEFMYQQLGIGKQIPADSERNFFARFQQMDLESAAFDANKDQMFEFLITELGVQSWRILGESLKQTAEFLDSIDADPNNKNLNDKMQAVMTKFEDEYLDYCMHNHVVQALCRMDREDVEKKINEKLAVFIAQPTEEKQQDCVE